MTKTKMDTVVISNEKDMDNVMELIDFRLKRRVASGAVKELVFGINVYKVKEVIFKPKYINKIPSSVEVLEGMINLRGKVIPVINLQKKFGYYDNDLDTDYLVITEFNNISCGFMVHEIKKIRRVSWQDIISPPPEIRNEFGDLVTSITILESGEIMLIIDFEKIIGEMNANYYDIQVKVEALSSPVKLKTILCVDDSSIARQMARKALEEVGFTVIDAHNGVDALNILNEYAQKAQSANESILLHIGAIISDIEMPLMDGYTFTKNVKENAILNPIPVILHSSLSKSIMASRGENVGAADFITKFSANNLIEAINKV